MAGRWTSPRAIHSEDEARITSAREQLMQITETELKEYQALKDLRRKYEKADELLGKVLLVAIAELGLRVTPAQNQALEDARAGKHPLSAPSEADLRSPSPSQEIRPAVGTQSNSVQGQEEPQSRATPLSTPTQTNATVIGAVPWGHILPDLNRRQCDPKNPSWYIAGENSKDYQVTSDDRTVWIAANHSRAKPESIEINHCINPPFVPGTHLRLKAMVKAEQVLDYANLHIRADSASKQKIADARRTIRDTFDWKPMTVEFDIPEGTGAMLYGITFESSGRVGIRDVSFEVLK